MERSANDQGASTPPATRLEFEQAPPLDTLQVVETPEGIDLRLRLAGPVPRAWALVIDSLIRAAMYLALTPLLALSDVGMGLILLFAFLIEWFYPVLFELWRGATPGKRAVGLLVVHDDGTPVGPAASMIRNLLRVIDFLPLFYGVGLASCVIDRRFRRLGDLAAGTLVIYREQPKAEHQIPSQSPVPPTMPLPLEAQQAVLDLAERAPRLSQARRTELAEIFTGPDGPRGQAAVEHLLGVANWLSRGR